MQHFMITLFECSISMTVIGILFMAVSPFLEKQFTAKGRYYAWIIMILGLIIPFRFHIPMLFIPFDRLIPELAIIDRSTEVAIYSGSVSVTTIDWSEIASAFWIIGVIVFMVYHINRHRRLLRMVKRWSTKYSIPQGLLMLQNLQVDMHITRRVQLRICPGIPCPMLIGIVRPVILLPSFNISDNELQFILKHELIHLKRGDLACKLFMFAATALHWFNPFVYRMAREINLQCEISCDEEVIKHATTSIRQQYVEALINVMKKQSSGQSIFSTSFSDGRQSMKKRIYSIMDNRSKKKGFNLLAIIMLSMFILGAALHLTPTKSNLLVADHRRPITNHEEIQSPYSFVDSVNSGLDMKEKQSETRLETGTQANSDSIPDDTAFFMKEQNTSNQLSNESKHSDNKKPNLFADSGVSRR